MTLFKRILMAAALFFSLSSAAQADVAGALDNFYGGSKAYVSGTAGGAYETQTRYALTGGNYVWRTPQVSTTLANISLPKISAGCGGIDMFVGGFSFVNGEQIEALFRAILQDAAGYAFMLAMEEISPMIAGNLKNLQNMVQKINSLNVNSCEAAKGIVDTIAGGQEAVQEKMCQVQGAIQGFFDDSFSGRACGDGATKSSDVISKEKADNPELDPPTNQNFAMKATAKGAFKDDQELREFYMSLTGTLVVTVMDEPEFHYIPPINLDESVVQALMSGGTIKGHTCQAVTIGTYNYTKKDCLQVLESGGEITIAAEDGFLNRVTDTLSSIYDNAANPNAAPLTDIQKAFINDTPLPVYQAAVLLAQDRPEIGKSILLSHSELIAYAMTLKFMEKSSRAVLEGSQSNPTADKDAMEPWRKGVTDNIVELSRLQSRLQERFQAVEQFIERMERVESRVTGNVNSQLLRSISNTSGQGG